MAPPTPSSVLRDPTTLTGPMSPLYPLTQDNLQDVLEYSTTSFGQTAVISCVARPRESHLCYITTHTAAPKTTWSSVQLSRIHHVELNSALLYINHSCAPTVEIVVRAPDPNDAGDPKGVAGEVRVARDRDLEVGDSLTFFYPSTEWESPRPFECLCGEEGGKCIGIQRGSKYLSKEVLDRYFINDHVHDLVAERDRR